MDWVVYLGLGLLWQGVLIIWVGGLPSVIVRRPVTRPEKGTREAFFWFWLEQYRFIGLSFTVLGAALAAWGWSSWPV